jgi:hypothetical protein
MFGRVGLLGGLLGELTRKGGHDSRTPLCHELMHKLVNARKMLTKIRILQ